MADKDKNIDEPQTIDGSPEYEDNEEKAEADEDIDPSTFPEKDLKKNLSYKQVAINKGLDVPDEDTGLVFTEHISSNCFKKFKGQSLEDFRPNEEEIGLINQLSMIPQAAPAWMCLRDVDPIGPPEAVDSQGDRFSKESTKDLVEQAINTPILMDHNHDIADRPPIGTCIKSRMTPKGPRETWAIPIEDYNGAVIKGLLNGTLNKVSVGMLIMPDNKICSSCGKSVYSFQCMHQPFQKDENGETSHVIIRRVDRYLERSLVNVPARTNTSIKNISADTIPNVKTIEDSVVSKAKETVESSKETKTEAGKFLDALDKAHQNLQKQTNGSPAEDEHDNDADSDFKQTNGSPAEDEHDHDADSDFGKATDEEDECFGKKKKAKGKDECKEPELMSVDEEDMCKGNTSVTDEDPDQKKGNTSVTDEDPDQKSKKKKPKDFDNDADDEGKKALKLATEKAVEFDKLQSITKSLAKTVAAQTDVIKSQSTEINKLITVATKQASVLDELTLLQKQLAKTVAEAMELSTQETLEKLLEVANYTVKKAKETVKEIDVKSNSDWTAMLFGPNARKL